MSALIRSVIDNLFAELEKKFAGRPLLLLALSAFHAAAIDLIPLLVAKAEESKKEGT